MKALFVALLVSACTRRLPVETATTAAAKRHAMYCFEADIKHKKGRRMAGCADTLPLCQEALGSARRWGSLGGVTRLFPCELWVSE